MKSILPAFFAFSLLFGCEAEETYTAYLQIEPLDRQIARANFGPLYVGIQINDGNIVTRYTDRRSDTSLDPIEMPSNRRNTITIYWIERYIDSQGETSLLYLSKQVQSILVGDSQEENFQINATHDDSGEIPPSELDLPSRAFRFVCDTRVLAIGGINPCSADADSDGISNLKERQLERDPFYKPPPEVCNPEISNC